MRGRNLFQEISEKYIRLGNVYYSALDIQGAASHFASPLLAIDDDVFPMLGDAALRRLGSAALVRFKTVPIVCATTHQLDLAAPNMICVYSARDREVVTCSNHYSFGHKTCDTGKERKDIELFGFSGARDSGKLSSISFFNVFTDYGEFNVEDIAAVLVVGYPSEHQLWNLGAGGIRFRPYSILAEFTGRGPADYLQATPCEPLLCEPEGLSGSPVFFIIFENDEFRVEIGGIVATASRELINFIPFTYAMPLLELATSSN